MLQTTEHQGVFPILSGNEQLGVNTNIEAAFLLTPYLKGYIEKPSYYFNNTDRKKLIELDLLLLTQGWSKYDWNDIFYSPIFMMACALCPNSCSSFMIEEVISETLLL